MTSLLVIAALAALLTGWFFYWKSHADKFEQSGYTPPATAWYAEFLFNFFAGFVTTLTVGKVKVIGREKSPKNGRAVFISNHQFPCDFAMLRRGSGRHFRMLTSADEMAGPIGAFAAAGGIISVNFKNKSDGAAAEQACIKAVAAKHFRIGEALAAVVWGVSIGVLIAAYYGAFAAWWIPALAAAAGLVVLALPGSDYGIGIFPQGGLLPDDPELKENFRPGAVRIARAAAALSGEPVYIVPMGINYNREPAKADWTHRFLSRYRSSFLGIRNPGYWHPLFRKDISGLPEAEREAIEAERKAIKQAQRKSHVTIYGGTVVVGDPIDVNTLPEDPIEASAVLRSVVAKLLAEAKTH